MNFQNLKIIVEKRSEVESLLGTLADQEYFFLMNLSRKINDYQTQSSGNDNEDIGGIDEFGVNVEFDESASEDEERNFVRESDDSSEDEGYFEFYFSSKKI